MGPCSCDLTSSVPLTGPADAVSDQRIHHVSVSACLNPLSAPHKAFANALTRPRSSAAPPSGIKENKPVETGLLSVAIYLNS